jgi:hypothetical protein
LQALDKHSHKPHQNNKDDDIVKLDRLQLINASARFELLSANQQLLDFHLNRIVNQKKYKAKIGAGNNPRAISEAVGNESDRDEKPHF